MITDVFVLFGLSLCFVSLSAWNITRGASDDTDFVDLRLLVLLLQLLCFFDLILLVLLT